MERLKLCSNNITPKETSQTTGERRNISKQPKTSPHPTVHPSIEHAQSEEKKAFRFREDSRPMFSPIPGSCPPDVQSEDSPRACRREPKARLTFPAIHVERCDKSQTPPACPPLHEAPRHDHHVSCGSTEERAASAGSGDLSVPSPYLHRKTDGRLLLMTQDSNLGLLSSWSRSEGNLPDAVQRSHSPASTCGALLDVRYRPDWQTGPSTRHSSDVTLHERGREGGRSPVTPRRLPSRLEPLPSLRASSSTATSPSLSPVSSRPLPGLSSGQRTLSASDLPSP